MFKSGGANPIVRRSEIEKEFLMSLKDSENKDRKTLTLAHIAELAKTEFAPVEMS